MSPAKIAKPIDYCLTAFIGYNIDLGDDRNLQICGKLHSFTDRVSTGGNAIASVRLFQLLNGVTFVLNILHVYRS